MILIKIVVFSIMKNNLYIFLYKEDLPQGIFQFGDLNVQVERIFHTTTGLQIDNNYREQLYTVSSDKNIEIVYYILVPKEKTNKIYKQFYPIDIVKEKTENNILEYAQQRLRWKIEYTNVFYSLLPENFTLSELQKGYEIILGRSLDKRNFRKKMLSLDFLIPTVKKTLGPTRPAQMYKFKDRKPMIIKIFS